MSEPGTPVEWCTHPRAKHVHGTYAAAIRDRCTCTACSTARRRRDKRSDLQRLRGNPGWVTDLTSLRAHLNQLLLWITPRQIEDRSGVNRTMIRYILGQAPGRRAAIRVRRGVHDALMAVTAEQVDQRDDCLVDPTGTIRRYQALVALGWPAAWLAPRLGVTASNLHTSLGRGRIRAGFRARVAEVYREISGKPPTPSSPRDAASISYARRRAAEQGWPPPIAWDDDELDDPNAAPHLDEPGASRANADAEDVAHLLDAGEGIDRIVERTGHNQRDALFASLRRGGHHAVADRLAAASAAEADERPLTPRGRKKVA